MICAGFSKEYCLQECQGALRMTQRQQGLSIYCFKMNLTAQLLQMKMHSLMIWDSNLCPNGLWWLKGDNAAVKG